jgi:hypothetical protein
VFWFHVFLRSIPFISSVRALLGLGLPFVSAGVCVQLKSPPKISDPGLCLIRSGSSELYKYSLSALFAVPKGAYSVY